MGNWTMLHHHWRIPLVLTVLPILLSCASAVEVLEEADSAQSCHGLFLTNAEADSLVGSDARTQRTNAAGKTGLRAR